MSALVTWDLALDAVSTRWLSAAELWSGRRKGIPMVSAPLFYYTNRPSHQLRSANTDMQAGFKEYHMEDFEQRLCLPFQIFVQFIFSLSFSYFARVSMRTYDTPLRSLPLLSLLCLLH